MAGKNVVRRGPSLMRVRHQKVNVPLDSARREGRLNKAALRNEIGRRASEKNRYALTRVGVIAGDGQGDHVGVIRKAGFRIAGINGENRTNISAAGAPAPGMKPRCQAATCETLQRRIAFGAPLRNS